MPRLGIELVRSVSIAGSAGLYFLQIVQGAESRSVRFTVPR